ncbi:efflux RND transporter permease subunit [Velocimicrobium porci]|uniref:MMPL family transporter n=1 Tax=Velocimicrobium porci TaxID=2606634 RepID=A0A6L5XY59_9FIRM|nr:efflux RND transporter permease subunit [Velocimicrobium porci]MSS63810.1 MMPL family transporter [Velocimicrobium porci]
MLSKFSVKKPYTVVVSVLLVIILGIVSFTEMTPDLLPSINLPYVVIVTPYVGASPETVEQTVTRPIEQSMATINNIKNISSTSSENYSTVMLEFEEETNMDSASIDIREKLDTVSGYWDDSVGTSTVMKLNPDMMPVMVAAVDVEGMDHIEVSAYTEDTIIPALESVEGVASVSTTGLIDKSIQVVINQDKIDKINKKLEKSVSGDLDKAEKKLKDAEEKISSGKEELEKKNKELSEGMTEASQKITEAKMELLKNEIKMADGEEELEAKEKELKTAETELSKNEIELKKQKTELITKEKEVKQGLSQINTGLDEIEEKETELKSGKEQLKASIEAIDNNDSLSETAKAVQLKILESSLSEIEKGLTTIEKTKKELEEKKTTAEAGLKQITEGKEKIESGEKELAKARTQLEQGKTALEQGKRQIQQGKAGLETGKSTLNQKESELNQKKAAAEAQLNSAGAELNSGEKELNTKKEEFDNQKEDALKAANVNDKITSDMVSNILQAQNFSMPAGYVTEEKSTYLVRVGDKIEDVDELKNLVLFDMNRDDIEPITLSDVADVFWADNADETYAKVNGNEGVMLSMQKQTTYSTKDVADKITEKLEELENTNKSLHTTYLMDQGMYIDMVVGSVLNNLIFGGILAIIILFLFLKDLKPTIIIACSIPISVIFAIVLMYFSGVTINIISLSGLAVGVGMLVDNSVVVIENIYRLRNKGVSPIKAAVNGAVQVAGAIMASTLTTVCVFLPIVFVKGMARQLFTDMALTIAYSLLASLIVALTLVPSMAAGLLKTTSDKEHKLFDKFIVFYEGLLRKALKIKPVVLIVAVAILVGSIWGAVKQGTAFMPDMDSTQISVSIEMPDETELEDTIKMADKVMNKIQKMDDVETVGAMLASNSMSGASASDQVSMYVILKEDKKQSSMDIAKQIEDKCKNLDCEVTASGSSMDMSALGGSGIVINVKGTELDELQKLAKDVAAKLRKVEGTQNISDGLEDPTSEIRITVNKEKAMIKGLTVAQIYQDIQNNLKTSKTATHLTKNGTEYEIQVANKENNEMTKEDIENYEIKVTGQDGTEKNVKLKNIAKITETEGLSSIRRDAQQRFIAVSAEIAEGYNVGLVSREAEKAFKNYKTPEGYEIEFDGENENINESLQQLGKMLLLAVLFIYLIMVAQFQSLLSPFIVMFTIPLAFTGGFLGLIIGGQSLSVVAMIGFIMLAGIVVNNGIVLVDYINQLRRDGMEKKEAIIEAGKTRMRPILMTALTTILGLFTMAIGVGMGADMMQPVAIVTIGGLLYATITTLFVIPTLYDILNRKEMKVIAETELEILDDEM